ncbi:MAG: hypothetical protein H6799_00825 [Candidatus Nomurabacteria bacterium]|nr:MAG: hypothetical protein H6799_00825 [Candidatus Nomurabacteria bacterium]
MKLIKKLLSLTVAFAFVLSSVALVPAPSSAESFNDGVCRGVNTVLNDTGGTISTDTNCAEGDGNDQLAQLVNNLINLFSIIVGAVSVIMIIYGGFKYITSGGSDDATKSAKNTILYALVGLIIVLISQTIVKFVFSKALSLNNGGSE